MERRPETIGDPRPQPRVVDRTAGTEKVRLEGRCRVCHVRGPSLNRAHLVARSQRGDDVDDNIVPLCGSGTTGCHGALTDHTKATWPSLYAGLDWRIIAGMLRKNLKPEERQYILKKKGGAWFDRVYPGL